MSQRSNPLFTDVDVASGNSIFRTRRRSYPNRRIPNTKLIVTATFSIQNVKGKHTNRTTPHDKRRRPYLRWFAMEAGQRLCTYVSAFHCANVGDGCVTVWIVVLRISKASKLILALKYSWNAIHDWVFVLRNPIRIFLCQYNCIWPVELHVLHALLTNRNKAKKSIKKNGRICSGEKLLDSSAVISLALTKSCSWRHWRRGSR